MAVYTMDQRSKFIEQTREAYSGLVSFLNGKKHDVKLASIYGNQSDHLILSNGVLLQGSWSYDNECFKYKPIDLTGEIIVRYEITPEDILKIRKQIESQISNGKGAKPLDQHEAARNLGQLVGSFSGKLIRDVPVLENRLYLTNSGLIEKTLTGSKRIATDQIPAIVERYRLSAESIKQIEALLK